MTVDRALIGAWLAARSIARGLPAPVEDHGGWRVDSGRPDETRRHVFAQPCEGLRALGETIDAPWVALKLCRPADELLALLPPRWRLTNDIGTRVMLRDAIPAGTAEMSSDYALSVERRGVVTFARIVAGEEIAASGYAAEHEGVLVYDRIVVTEAHRRRGLGRALMAALGNAGASPTSREILTATPAGRALYLTIGWHDYSDYSTAMIPS